MLECPKPSPIDILWLLAVLVVLSLAQSTHAECNSHIYCKGEFLIAMQRARFEKDSKTFVDMPLRASPAQVLSAFAKLPTNASSEDLKQFANTWMYPAGYEVASVVPRDYREEPDFVPKLPAAFQPLALSLNSKWKDLVRTFNFTGLCDECHSSIPVPHPFVVAGGRFREFYYWDSYWIIQGLLVSGMYDTARDIIENFLYMVETVGFVPNGGRIYYLNRSQPPMLTLMVQEYYNSNPNTTWLTDIFPTLEKEYQFWMTRRRADIIDAAGNVYRLNRYVADTIDPRPESYNEDCLTCVKMEDKKLHQKCYKALASGAESGWDFSSRWLSDFRQLSSIRTPDIIPVDLNSILYANEVALSHFAAIVGNETKAAIYSEAAAQRKIAIQVVLFDTFFDSWADWINSTQKYDHNFYPSIFTPIWSGAFHQQPQQAFNLIKRMWPKIMFAGGIPTSVIATGQQWDFPNAWAPLQQFIIDALDKLAAAGISEAQIYADELASVWVTTNYCAWWKTAKNGGIFFEKYDVTHVGGFGGGGEYDIQTGFGWTNGVLLKLLATRGSSLTLGTCTN